MQKVQASSTANALLIQATGGDQRLIALLSEQCIRWASENPSKKLSWPIVEKAIHEFIDNEAQSYTPLHEALRLIESDPDLLICTLLLINKGIVHKRDLPLPLSPDIDPLYLTGIVKKEFLRVINFEMKSIVNF